MLNIGDFAGITGLSVKALRHYDEKGLLVPDSVDERSGYRRYGEGQVRAGATVRALRAAGLSLPEIAEAAAQDSAVSAVRAHRDRVLVEREREDRAFAAAEQELRALRVPVSIELRHAPEQHFVGRPLHAPSEDPDALTDDDANAAFAELYGQLVGAGIPLSGEFWTALRSGERGDLELVGCWAVPGPFDSEWAHPGDHVGILPARTELVAQWRPEHGEELPDGATHPAIIALFDALDERGIELRLNRMEVRQTVLGQDPDDFTVEVSVRIHERTAG
ncbi:DNA-binding transcriptional MerR regulator [Leucobacter luti]|uniref:MerR family transcriptional regulator n=1 Tax=Leucobacter luti TaxID=340320 RepID=UPI0010540D9A|nr:MerR family transcriptional regulator [Leucobacter luti]MCW2288485.1 DNA-binding transcriptional MerR regulator [Leucobacter luti]TCK45359.1 DNA-binding transcriptional MerR regulator [Leucobacter luti]